MANSLNVSNREKKTLYIEPHCGTMGKNKREILNGEKGVFSDSTAFGKNSDSNGTFARCFLQSYPEF
jgi:hypothetical protein